MATCRDKLDAVALVVAQHLFDHDVRMFCFVGTYAAVLAGASDTDGPIQVYISMSTSLRVWEEQHLLPFDNVFKRTTKKGNWIVNEVQIEFLRENPTFYLLGSPPFVSRRPAEGEMLKQLVPEIQLLLADTLRDWREQLDNASQARMVRFWLDEMVKREMRFGWRHPGPETAEIAREFLEDAEDDVELKVKFEKAGLRLGNDEYLAVCRKKS